MLKTIAAWLRKLADRLDPLPVPAPAPQAGVGGGHGEE